MSYGNICLVNTKKGFVPNAIKFLTNSNVSHSLITLPNLLDTPMCIEAAFGGIDTCRFDKEYIVNDNEGYELWNIKIDQDIKDTAIKSILNDLEVTYGFLEYPWFIWRWLNKLVGKDIKNQNNWVNSGLICSQLCVAYLKACQLDVCLIGYGRGSIAPSDLRVIMQNHPELFELVFVKE